MCVAMCVCVYDVVWCGVLGCVHFFVLEKYVLEAGQLCK